MHLIVYATYRFIDSGTVSKAGAAMGSTILGCEGQAEQEQNHSEKN